MADNNSARMAFGMTMAGLVVGITGGPVADLMSNKPVTYKAPLIASAVGLAFGLAFGSLLNLEDRLHVLETKR